MLNLNYMGRKTIFTPAYRPTADIPRSVLENSDAFSEEQVQAFERLFDDTWHFLTDREQVTLLALSFFVPAIPVLKNALSEIISTSESELDADLTRLQQLRLIDITSGVHDVHLSLNRLVHRCVSRYQNMAAAHRERWLNYYVHFLEKHGDDDVGSEIGYGESENNQQLEGQIDHIRMAVAWAFEHQPLTAIHMTERITTLLLDTGRWDERIRLCTQSLQIATQHELIPAQIGFAQRLGWSHMCREDYQSARVYMKKALDLIRQHPRLEHHPARLPQILRDMGILYAYMSDRHFQRAIALIEQSEAVSRYRQLDNSLTLAQIFRAWGLSLHGDSQREHGASEAALKLYDQAYRLLDSVIPQVVEKKYYRQQALLYRLLADTLIKLPYPDNRLELAHKYLELASGFAEPFYKAYVQAELSKSWGDWYLAVGNRELAQLSYRNAYHLAVVWGLRHKPGNLLQRIQQLDGGENIRRQAKSVDTPGKNDSSEPTSSKIRFIQPDNHPFESQIKTVIDELRSDAIRQHPTKSEQILNLFLQQPYHEITLREMVPLFAGTYNPEQAARNLIAKLNAKLGQVGCRIEHVAAYRIVSASQSK